MTDTEAKGSIVGLRREWAPAATEKRKKKRPAPVSIRFNEDELATVKKAAEPERAAAGPDDPSGGLGGPQADPGTESQSPTRNSMFE